MDKLRKFLAGWLDEGKEKLEAIMNSGTYASKADFLRTKIREEARRND